MKPFFIILLWLAAILRVANGQAGESDSLEKLLAQTRQDTNRVLLLTELAANYQFFNSDTALTLLNEAMKLSQKLNFSKGQIRVLTRMGDVLHVRGELPQALEAQMRALQLTSKSPDAEGEAQCLIFTALIYIEVGEYRQGLNYLFKAKKFMRRFCNNCLHPASRNNFLHLDCRILEMFMKK